MPQCSKSFRSRATNLRVMADHPETDFRLMNLLLSTAEELEQYADEIERSPAPHPQSAVSSENTQGGAKTKR